MSAVIALIVKFLPLLLQILSVLFGGGAAMSHSVLQGGEAPMAMSSGTYLTYVGGYGAASILSLVSSIIMSHFNIKREASQVDWGATIAGLKGVNVTALIQLVARVFKLVSADAEASRLLKEVFGVSTTATIPLSQDDVIQALLQRVGKS